jgi:hypothetical protein
MTITPPDVRAGSRDFDFLFGSWHVANERLRSRLAGSHDWERFDAVATCRPILGGLGNVDDFRPSAEPWKGFEGGALRLFNPATGLWSIHWADNVTCQLQPPVVGRFVGGMGEFFGDDRHDGRPIQIRFIWSEITADAARWEQAFSPDSGATWETNWVMAFSRTGANSGGG